MAERSYTRNLIIVFLIKIIVYKGVAKPELWKI